MKVIRLMKERKYVNEKSKARRIEILTIYNKFIEEGRAPLLRSIDLGLGGEKMPHPNLFKVDATDDYWTDNINVKETVQKIIDELEQAGFETYDREADKENYEIVFAKPGEAKYNAVKNRYEGRAMVLNFDGENIVIEPVSRYYNFNIRHTIDDIYSYESWEEFMNAVISKSKAMYNKKYGSDK